MIEQVNDHFLGHLFHYQYCENIDTGYFQYEGCKMKKTVGVFNEGANVPFICIDYLDGIIEFLDDDGESIGTYRVRLEVA